MCVEEKIVENRSLAEFLEKIECWQDRWGIPGECAIYRGHADYNWILVAKLFRNPNAGAVFKRNGALEGVQGQLLPKNDAHSLERRLLHDFSRYLYAYRPDLACTVPEEEKESNIRAMQEWRQLAIGQHYGLPTRFLDFTTNALVALFFAVEGSAACGMTKEGKREEQDSAVWCIEVPNWQKVWQAGKKNGKLLSPLEFAQSDGDFSADWFDNTVFVPEHIDGRIHAQGSVFMCEHWGNEPQKGLDARLRDRATSIVDLNGGKRKETRTMMIRIRAKDRECLRNELDLVGINRATLFPDLGSAASYLAWAVHQRGRGYRT